MTLFAIGVLCYAFITKAGVATFYPFSCLGNWHNVQNALGKPDLVEGDPDELFTDENSARSWGSDSQIFCGSFVGDGDEEKTFQAAHLRLFWAVKNESSNEIAPPLDTASGGTGGSAGETVPSEEASATAWAEDDAPIPEDTTTSSPSEPVAPSEGVSGSPENITPVPTESQEPSGNATTTSAPDPDASTSSPQASRPREGGLLASILRSVRAEGPGVASDTLVIPFDVSSSTNLIAAPPVSREDSDVLYEVAMSLDGSMWDSLIKMKSPEDEATIQLPIRSWDELKRLQIRIREIAAGKLQKTMYLDGMIVDVEYGIPEESTGQVAPSPTEKEREVYDARAEHSCTVEPFSVNVAKGASAVITLSLHPAHQERIYQTEMGPLPSGVLVEVGEGKDPQDKTLTFRVGEDALVGSFNAVIVYKEIQKDGGVIPSACQYNLVIE